MQPQRSRESLSISDFLPSKEDAAELESRAVHFLMHFLTEEFEAIIRPKKYAPKQKQLHQSTKTEVVPIEVLFKDEKYRSKTIEFSHS